MGFEPPADEVAAAFPTFRSLLSVESRYLALLHLPKEQAPFDELIALLSESPDAASELDALFAHGDWRGHLVAALAMLASGEPHAVAALWRRLELGTWVAPQLAAAAFVLDPDFETRARAHLGGDAPLKTQAALGALYRRLPSPRLTVLAQLGEPRLTRSQEGQDGARYALEWLDRLIEVAPPSVKARWPRLNTSF